MTRVKYLVARLREQKDRLSQKTAVTDPQWLEETKRLLEDVFDHDTGLAQQHAGLWRQDTSAGTATYRESLDAMIRGLNRTDEVRLTTNPVFLLTAIGILFMFLLAGGSYLFYVLFL